MVNRTLSISMPDNLADFVENEVKKGDYASASDFMRILIRDYQAHSSERWIERLIEQRRDSAQNPANLIEQDCKGRIECVPPGRRKSVPGGSWIRPPRAPRPRLPARLRCSRGGIGRCGLASGLLPVAAGLEPVAVAVQLEHVDVVGQPVEQGARETLRTQHGVLPQRLTACSLR